MTSAKCDLRIEQQPEKREESREKRDGSGDIGLLFYFIFCMSCVCGVVSMNLHRGIREESSSDRRGKRAESKEIRFHSPPHFVASR